MNIIRMIGFAAAIAGVVVSASKGNFPASIWATIAAILWLRLIVGD